MTAAGERFTLKATAPDMRRRRRAERRFRFISQAALILAGAVLVLLIMTIARNSVSAFRQLEIGLDLPLSEETGRASLKEAMAQAAGLSLAEEEGRALLALLGGRAAREAARQRSAAPPLGEGAKARFWLTASDDADLFLKERPADSAGEETGGRLSPLQKKALARLEAEGRTRFVLARFFFVNADSREPEYAGIRAAFVGSFLTLLITLVISFPIGMLAAIYLESFAPKNRWTDFIELNINNLAAIPSIIFGLLGLRLFLDLWGLPRSTPLVGGMALALMTLPTIIIATRAALAAIPAYIQEAALALGASSMQSVLHHVVPLALPGVMTGAIIGMARALGETAPLLMIGMVAFIAAQPSGFTDPATVLPVQIYLWSDSPERSFSSKASAAILILLLFLMAMNALAVYLRKRYEKRW